MSVAHGTGCGAASSDAADRPDGHAAGALPPGSLVAERYRIIEMLGEGGMGAVYRVEHVHMRKHMALKVLHASMSGTEEVVARFEREAIAAGHIQHPNIVAASDFGKLPDGSFFLVLELVEGQSLRKLLNQGAVAPLRAIRIVYQIAAALGAAHGKGVVHRDLKPENVMLVERPASHTADGSDEVVKVLDFGIAKVDVETVSAGNVGASGSGGSGKALTRVGAVFGTPDYMSPEQAMGQPVDARSDLYSIGIVLYELLTGERPFRGGVVTVLRQHVLEDVPPLPNEIVAQLDPRVLVLLERLLAKTPDTRMTSAVELHRLLGEILARPELPPPTMADPQPFGSLPTMMAGAAIAGSGAVSATGLGAGPGSSARLGVAPPSSSTAVLLPETERRESADPRDLSLTPALPPITNPRLAASTGLAGVAGLERLYRRDWKAIPPWMIAAGLALVSLFGLLLVGIVLRRVLAPAKTETDTANASSSSSAAGSRGSAVGPIDLPPPPPPAGTAATTGGGGTPGANGTTSDTRTGGNTATDEGARGGSTGAKDTRSGKGKGRKTGPFGIYIPPPKEW